MSVAKCARNKFHLTGVSQQMAQAARFCSLAYPGHLCHVYVCQYHPIGFLFVHTITIYVISLHRPFAMKTRECDMNNAHVWYVLNKTQVYSVGAVNTHCLLQHTASLLASGQLNVFKKQKYLKTMCPT